jgi:beta-lactam-binding protein with PASTA domain
MFVAVLLVAGCGSHSQYVDLPSNHGHALDDALQRLNDVGLRATFPAAKIPCGDGLPGINIQSPRAPVRVKKGSVVTLTFLPSFVGSLAVPKQHARWTYVPQLVGHEYIATTKVQAIQPCIRLKAATATSASRIVVVAQNPPAGTRVPAFGVETGRGFKPSTVDLRVAAQP